MLDWCCFLVVIADECSSGRISLFLLLMSARLAACRYCYDRCVLVLRHFGIIITDECSSGGVTVLLLLMSARLAAFRCCYC